MTKTPRMQPSPTTARTWTPSGVWIALSGAGELVGVFDSFDLAETACRGLSQYRIANVDIDRSYRGRIVDWRVSVVLKS